MHSFDLEAIRRIALGEIPVDKAALLALLDATPQMEATYVSHAWSVIALRRLMSIVPKFDRTKNYNERKRAIKRLIESRGLRDVTDNDLEVLVDLSSRFTDFVSETRKRSWSDLHYKKRHEILVAQGHRCIVCGTPLYLGEPRRDASPELDHVIPFAFGGNSDDNVRIICRGCNRAKSDDPVYITAGRIATNYFARREELARIRYWKLEASGRACAHHACAHSSSTSLMLIERIESVAAWSYDNCRVVCEHHADRDNCYPAER